MAALSVDAVADILWRAGFRGEGLINGIATVGAESGYDPLETGQNHDAAVNPPGVGDTIDRGLWQLNSYWHREVSDAAAYDANASSREAYRISGGGTSFSQWYGFSKGGYKKHLADARSAAAGAAGRAGGPSGATTPVGDPTPTDNAPGEANGSGVTKAALHQPAPQVALPYNTPDALPGDDRPLTRADISIGGKVLEGGTLEDLVLGAPALELTLEEAGQLTFSMSDPGLGVLGAGLVTVGVIVHVAELPLVVSVLEPAAGDAGEILGLTCREQTVELMKGARGAGPTGDLSPSQVASFWAGNFAAVGAVRGLVVEASPERTGLVKETDKNDPYGRLETTWAQLKRYATELGFIFGITGGILYFGRPSFITAQAPGFIVNYRAGSVGNAEDPFGMLAMPSLRRTFDYDSPPSSADAPASFTETIDVLLPQRRACRVRPAMRLELHGVPSFDGSYMVTKVTGPIDADTSGWMVSAVKPKDPPPSLVANDATLPGATTPAGVAAPAQRGTNAAVDFVAFCRQQAGKRYVYGAEVGLDDPNPSAFDCSELVQWACAQVGVYIPDGSGAQFAYCEKNATLVDIDQAASTPGCLLFLGGGRGTQHVAVTIGDGVHTIEARGSQYGVMEGLISDIRFENAAAIPGMKYPRAPRLRFS